MNVKTLCLAILHRGDATGYEIRKLSAEGEYSYFVEASFGAIYPALARLEADGLVTVREEAQSGKPSRKVYSITPAGRTVLVDQLSAAPAEDVYRSEFMLVAMNAALVSRAHLAAAVDQRLAALSTERQRLQEMAGRGEPGLAWIARYGIACLTAQIGFLTANRADLEARAGADTDEAAGAALTAAAE